MLLAGRQSVGLQSSHENQREEAMHIFEGLYAHVLNVQPILLVIAIGVFDLQLVTPLGVHLGNWTVEGLSEAPISLGALAACASAAARFRSKAKLDLKYRKTKAGNDGNLDQAVDWLCCTALFTRSSHSLTNALNNAACSICNPCPAISNTTKLLRG